MLMMTPLPAPHRYPREQVILLDGPHWSTDLVAANNNTPLQWTPPEVGPDSVAYLTMTSGSTGKPKAVVNSHRGAVVCFWGRYAIFPYREDAREGLNVFFAWECLRAILQGKTAVIIPDELILDPKGAASPCFWVVGLWDFRMLLLLLWLLLLSVLQLLLSSFRLGCCHSRTVASSCCGIFHAGSFLTTTCSPPSVCRAAQLHQTGANHSAAGTTQPDGGSA